jgi:hypothetical protein
VRGHQWSVGVGRGRRHPERVVDTADLQRLGPSRSAGRRSPMARGCAAGAGLRRRHLAAIGSVVRQAPSSTQATTMRTVIACAVRDPQASSSTLEATDVAVFNSSRGIEPSASVASPRHGRRRRSGSSAARDCPVLSLRAEIQTTATEVLSGRRHPVQTPDKAV